MQARAAAEMLLAGDVRVARISTRRIRDVLRRVGPDTRRVAHLELRARLDQNDLGLRDALKTLRTLVAEAKAIRTSSRHYAHRASGRPIPPPADLAAPAVRPGWINGPSSPVPLRRASPPAGNASDSILDDPAEAYRAEVKDALMNAMLDYSRGLELGDDEMLTVAARGNDPGSRLGPADSQSRTTMISVRRDRTCACFWPVSCLETRRASA